MGQIFYRITAQDTKVYTCNLETCDRICAAMINNGFEPKVKRFNKRQISLCDLELVNTLLGK